MKFLTSVEAELWTKNRYVNLELHEQIACYTIQGEPDRRNILARLISKLDWGSEYLLYITEYGVWPSAENWNLFLGYRKSLGCAEELHVMPGQLLAFSERAELHSLLALMFYFSWGGYLISADGNKVISISHDDFQDVYVRGNGIQENIFRDQITHICASDWARSKTVAVCKFEEFLERMRFSWENIFINYSVSFSYTTEFSGYYIKKIAEHFYVWYGEANKYHYADFSSDESAACKYFLDKIMEDPRNHLDYEEKGEEYVKAIYDRIRTSKEYEAYLSL